MYLLLAHTPAQAASSCIGHQRRLLKRTLLDRRPMRSPRVKQQLYEVAMTLKIHTSLVITLAVHSNSRGSSRSNLRKTQRTADKLKAYLVRKYNLAPRRIIARGFGERCPIAPNRTREGRQKNSRAEWWLPKGMKSPKSAFVSSTSIVAKKSPPRRISQRLRLFFASGTHKLRPAQRRTLQAWSHRIKNRIRGRRYIVTIAGHAHAREKQPLRRGTKALSQKRALVVAKWLRLFLVPTRPNFVIRGDGDTHPLRSNRTVRGRRFNRRVEISVRLR